MNHQVQFIRHKPWVRHGLRVPRRSWQGLRRAAAPIEGFDHGPLELVPVAALRPESKPCAHLAADAHIVDELRTRQGQAVQVPPRLLAPRAAIKERRTRTSWERAAQDRESLGHALLEREHDRVGLPGRRHLQNVADSSVVRDPEDQVRSLTGILQDPARREGRQPGNLLDVDPRAGEPAISIAVSILRCAPRPTQRSAY